MSSRQPVANAFLNGPNYQKIVGFLRQHYQKKMGTAIPDRVDARIQRSVQHYMQEVSRIQGTKPVAVLTQEVLRETTTSVDTWLSKQEPVKSAITTLGAFPPVPKTNGMGMGSESGEDYSRLYEDTSTSYERLMSDRAPPPMSAPPVPDFRIGGDMLESSEDPVVLMQRLQKARDEQARAMGLPLPPPTPATGPAPAGGAAGTGSSLLPTNSVTGGTLPPPRLTIREDPPSAAAPVPPQAEAPPPPLAPRPQDYIIPQEDVVKYREKEFNIFMTSSDRDWLRNTSENRYNFSVNFNTGSKRSGFSFNAALQERFRNIQRVEFVKAIVPIESLTSLVKVTAESPSIVYDTTRVVNVFSLPFASVRIAELNTSNGFSTRPEEDNSFAMVQYDTTWSSDLVSQAVQGTSPAAVLTKSGYTGLIPKFLKCQREYTPTPLATLQRMSLRVERHNGTLLSDDSDVWFVDRVCMSDDFSSIGTDSTLYGITNPQNSYIFIRTSKFFPYSAVGEGDTIQIQGFACSANTNASLDFVNWLTREEGHYVVAQAFVNVGALTDGRNTAGYCNVIVLRNRFNDPTTGSVNRTNVYFGGTSGEESTLATYLNLTQENQSGCGLINYSRQTHFVLRIITRNMDSSSNIRPDNV